MFKDVNILSWIGLFFAYFFLDIIYILNVQAISKRNAFMVANTSVLLFFLGVWGTVSYIDNLINLVPIVVGSYLGSYLSVKKWRKKDIS